MQGLGALSVMGELIEKGWGNGLEMTITETWGFDHFRTVGRSEHIFALSERSYRSFEPWNLFPCWSRFCHVRQQMFSVFGSHQHFALFFFRRSEVTSVAWQSYLDFGYTAIWSFLFDPSFAEQRPISLWWCNELDRFSFALIKLENGVVTVNLFPFL